MMKSCSVFFSAAAEAAEVPAIPTAADMASNETVAFRKWRRFKDCACITTTPQGLRKNTKHNLEFRGRCRFASLMSIANDLIVRDLNLYANAYFQHGSVYRLLANVIRLDARMGMALGMNTL